MPEAYDKDYSRYYDLLYSDKDYIAECDFIEKIFSRFSSHPVKSIFELGCGTGGHAIHFARRGYDVAGIDLSDGMIAAAGEKARKAGLKVDFRVMDIRDVKMGRTFDACLSMFGVMGYITSTDELISAFRYIRKHLDNDSLFTLDFWNGLAVMHIKPESRVKEVTDGDIRVIRAATSQLDPVNHLCQVNYNLLVLRDQVILEEIKEVHTVRFFFPQEMAHYLKDAGFRILHTCPFLELDKQVDESWWNISMVATTAA